MDQSTGIPLFKADLGLQRFAIGEVINVDHVDLSTLNSDVRSILKGVLGIVNSQILDLPLPFEIPIPSGMAFVDHDFIMEAGELRFEADVTYGPSPTPTPTPSPAPSGERFTCLHDQCVSSSSGGVDWATCDAICGKAVLPRQVWERFLDVFARATLV